MSNQRKGFGMIELLVILVILAMLVSLFLPAIHGLRNKSASTNVMNNLKQIGLAVYSVNDVYKALPPACDKFGAVQSNQTISVHLLPFLEQGPLYTQIQNKGKCPADVTIPPCSAPIDPSNADSVRVQNFAANVRVFTDDGVKTAFDMTVALKSPMVCTSAIPRTFPDGTSNTIIFMTRYAASGAQTKNGGSTTPCGYYDLPTANDGGAFVGATPMAKSPITATSISGWQLNPALAEVDCAFAKGLGHSFTKQGIAVLLGDASTRTVNARITAQTWNYAMQPNDGNVLGADW